MSELVRVARAVSFTAHLGQVDKLGEPYFEHVNRVAHRVLGLGPLYTAVAYLHDTVEDTVLTLDHLRELWFPEVVVLAVEAITHPQGEPNINYWTRVRANPIALDVKLADIDDNSNPARLELLDMMTRIRLQKKYRDAKEFLTR